VSIGCDIDLGATTGWLGVDATWAQNLPRLAPGEHDADDHVVIEMRFRDLVSPEAALRLSDSQILFSDSLRTAKIT
jgi:hypothetical protein